MCPLFNVVWLPVNLSKVIRVCSQIVIALLSYVVIWYRLQIEISYMPDHPVYDYHIVKHTNSDVKTILFLHPNIRQQNPAHLDICFGILSV